MLEADVVGAILYVLQEDDPDAAVLVETIRGNQCLRLSPTDIRSALTKLSIRLCGKKLFMRDKLQNKLTLNPAALPPLRTELEKQKALLFAHDNIPFGPGWSALPFEHKEAIRKRYGRKG